MTTAEALIHCQEVLSPIYGTNEARNMASILLEHLTGLRTPKRYNILSSNQIHDYFESLHRLLKGEPIQYVIGYTFFYGQRFKTDSRALIPRPETEELVHLILDQHSGIKPLRVLDVGTGTGCIAISLKYKRPSWDIWALDYSAPALALCMENMELLNLKVHPIHANILNEAEWGKLGQFDLIVSNPPYICPSEKVQMSAQVLNFEPQVALFVPETDPFLFYSAIAQFAAIQLKTGGKVYLEINEFRAAALIQLLELTFDDVELLSDMQGKNRMIACKKM
jgi:release factor glutamine methyltransferase